MLARGRQRASPGQAFAFVMDTRPCETALELARDADRLVRESTYLDEDRALADEAGHRTAAQVATLARDGNARPLMLTHFSQHYSDPTATITHSSRGANNPNSHSTSSPSFDPS